MTSIVLACNDTRMPQANDLLTYIYESGPQMQATMFVPLALTCLSFVVFIDEVIFFVTNNIHWKRTACLIWVVAIFPIISCLGLIGIFIPRVLQLIKMTIVFIYTIGLKKFFALVLTYYGGKKDMEIALAGKETVSANPFPCCFICCCRSKPLTMRRLHILEGLVTQVIFVYPIAYFIQLVIAIENFLPVEYLALVFFIFEFILAASSLTCLYGIVIIGKSSRKPLQEFSMRAKFGIIQLLLVFITLQDVTFDILQSTNALPCGFPYPNSRKGIVFHMYLISVEMFAMSVLGWFVFRKSEAECKVIPRECKKQTFKSSSDFTANGSSVNTYENVFRVEISSDSGDSHSYETIQQTHM